MYLAEEHQSPLIRYLLECVCALDISEKPTPSRYLSINMSGSQEDCCTCHKRVNMSQSVICPLCLRAVCVLCIRCKTAVSKEDVPPECCQMKSLCISCSDRHVPRFCPGCSVMTCPETIEHCWCGKVEKCTACGDVTVDGDVHGDDVCTMWGKKMK